MKFRDDFNDDLNDCILDVVGDEIIVDGVSVLGIWNRPYYANEAGGDFDHANRDPWIDIPESVGAGVGSRVIFENQPYDVCAIEPDGEGRVICQLRAC